MSVTKACLVFLILFVCMAEQCNSTPPEYRRLFKLPRDQQAEVFKKYPIEQQVDIYISAIEGVEPPATQFTGFLASNGKKVIPILLKKLKEEKIDRIRYYYISVFDEIHMNYCSLRDKREVVETITAAIAEMKDPSYQELCEIFLKKLIDQPGSNKSC